jgi:hypothetical protein
MQAPIVTMQKVGIRPQSSSSSPRHMRAAPRNARSGQPDSLHWRSRAACAGRQSRDRSSRRRPVSPDGSTVSHNASPSRPRAGRPKTQCQGRSRPLRLSTSNAASDRRKLSTPSNGHSSALMAHRFRARSGHRAPAAPLEACPWRFSSGPIKEARDRIAFKHFRLTENCRKTATYRSLRSLQGSANAVGRHTVEISTSSCVRRGRHKPGVCRVSTTFARVVRA